MTLTDRISILAKERNLTFAGLERMAGLGNGTIKRWDKNDPSASKLLQVANLLDVTVDYLLTGNNSISTEISQTDAEWLSLIHQLPSEAQYEFKGELKGYLKRLKEESADELKQAK